MNAKIRKCIGCANSFDRCEMFRLMKKYDTNEIIFEPSSKDFGRSVYICKNKKCIENAFKKGKITRYFKDFETKELKLKLEKAL